MKYFRFLFANLISFKSYFILTLDGVLVWANNSRFRFNNHNGRRTLDSLNIASNYSEKYIGH